MVNSFFGQEGRLEGVLSIVRVVHDSPADGEDHGSVPPHQRFGWGSESGNTRFELNFLGKPVAWLNKKDEEAWLSLGGAKCAEC